MFEYAQSVFQYPTYDSELVKLYNLRREKYTISQNEIELLKTLLLQNPPHACVVQEGYTKPHRTVAYMTLIRIIQYQLEHVKEKNAEISKHPIKRFLPKRFFKQDTKKLKLALHSVRYHHHSLMALDNPDIEFNHALGRESLRRRFQVLPKQFNPSKRRSFAGKYSAKNIATYLKSESRASWFFRDKNIDALYETFNARITSVKAQSKQLNLVKNKKTLQRLVKAKCDEKYTEMGGNPEIQIESQSFGKRLAYLIGLGNSRKVTRPPVRNLLMQEVGLKLADTSLDEASKAKIKVITSFSRKVTASSKAADYSVLDGNLKDFKSLKSSLFKTANSMVDRYSAFVVGSSSTDIFLNDMLKMPAPLSPDQFHPKVSS